MKNENLKKNVAITIVGLASLVSGCVSPEVKRVEDYLSNNYPYYCDGLHCRSHFSRFDSCGDAGLGWLIKSERRKIAEAIVNSSANESENQGYNDKDINGTKRK